MKNVKLFNYLCSSKVKSILKEYWISAHDVQFVIFVWTAYQPIWRMLCIALQSVWVDRMNGTLRGRGTVTQM